ncbi:MAG TPA: TonB-dependent receptor [Candidatus Sulfotelmatobacter sp.]|nr:TonB-dependent receptor [Candidatus Sulfotelmatobacter sp.]
MKRNHPSRMLLFSPGFLATLAVILLLAISAAAQRGTGTIGGRAVDRRGAVLQGALVELQPQGMSLATNTQGEFTVTDLAPRDYTVKVSYVGFAPFSTTVEVKAGQAVRIEAVLKVAAKSEEITVIGERPHGEAEAINRERTSDNILNVLPSDVITSLPNANIADAVGRLPSVTLERDEGEGKYVQVRGTEPRLNNLTIDGINVPSPEAGVRQVKLDTIPADIIESVEINKTLSANQDGDAIGGSVNLRTKTAGELPTLSLETIGGWTPIVNTRYIGHLAGTAGERFGHDKRFGALFSGSYDYNGRGIDDIEPSPDLGQVTPYYDSMDLREYRYYRTRYGFAGSLDYKLKDPASGLHFHYFYSDFRDFGDKWVYTLNDGGGPAYSNENRAPDYAIGDLAIGGKHVFERSWLSWEVSAARARQTAAAGNPGSDFQYNGTATCSYDQAATKNIHLPQFNPGCDAVGSPIFDPTQWSLQDVNLTSGNTSQVNLQGAVSYARNYHLASRASTFEFGLKVRNAHKGQDAYSPAYDNPPSTPPQSLLMTNFLDQGFTNPNYYFKDYVYGPVTDFHKITNNLNSLVSQGLLSFDSGLTHLNSDASNYDLTERVSAAYAMNTIEFGRFRLQTGLRIETTQLNTRGYIVNNDASGNWISTVPTPANAWYWDPLPSVQMRYRITDNSDIRAVYGRGISRPDPYDTIPYVTLDQSSTPPSIGIGNPNLKPEHANSYDLLYRHYLKPFGEFQAGFFYKQLSAPIYYVDNPFLSPGDPYYNQYPNYHLDYIINGHNAKLYGFEAAYIQHLGFLPGALSGFGISANYSWTGSNSGALPLRPDTPALQRQAPVTWNFSPTYDRGRFSSRLGVSYNGSSIFQYQWQQCTAAQANQGAGCEDPSSIGSKGPAGDIYFFPHTQVDAQASFRIQKSLTVLAQGLNLTNEVFGFYNGSPWYMIQREYYNRTYSFGLRWQPRRED